MNNTITERLNSANKFLRDLATLTGLGMIKNEIIYMEVSDDDVMLVNPFGDNVPFHKLKRIPNYSEAVQLHLVKASELFLEELHIALALFISDGSKIEYGWIHSPYFMCDSELREGIIQIGRTLGIIEPNTYWDCNFSILDYDRTVLGDIYKYCFQHKLDFISYHVFSKAMGL